MSDDGRQNGEGTGDPANNTGDFKLAGGWGGENTITLFPDSATPEYGPGNEPERSKGASFGDAPTTFGEERVEERDRGTTSRDRQSAQEARKSRRKRTGEKTRTSFTSKNGRKIPPWQQGGETDTNEETEDAATPFLLDVPQKRGRPRKRLDKQEQISQILRVIADIHQSSKPALFHPELQPDILRQLWQISDAEIDTISQPIAEMLPTLPPRVANVIERISNPLALLGAVYIITFPRYQQERLLLQAVKDYNAGYIQNNDPTKQAENGNNANTTQQNPVTFETPSQRDRANSFNNIGSNDGKRS